jgi:exopolyphosphatase/guanosine-5'-triphosphate,3'-diphosphate pyrophosphatase
MDSNMIISAIDIGTNSVRCLVSSFFENTPKSIYEGEKYTRLGENLSKTGTLSEEAIFRTITAVKEFHETALQMGAEKIILTGTSACREASNTGEMAKIIKDSFSLELTVLSETKEGEIIILGVDSNEKIFSETPADSKNNPAEIKIIADVGSGSTELIQICNDEKIIKNINLGALKLFEEFPELGGKSSIDTIKEAVDFSRNLLVHALDSRFIKPSGPERSFKMTATGGAATGACMMIQKMINYSPDKIQGCKIGILELEALISEICMLNFSSRCKTWALKKRKADILPAGLIILAEIMRFFEIQDVMVSHYDILQGLINDYIKNLPK